MQLFLFLQTSLYEIQWLKSDACGQTGQSTRSKGRRDPIHNVAPVKIENDFYLVDYFTSYSRVVEDFCQFTLQLRPSGCQGFTGDI